MIIWLGAVLLAGLLVALWTWGERRWLHDLQRPAAPLLSPAFLSSRILLFVVLVVAFHSAVDRDLARQALILHFRHVARASYAFAVTAALLLAFPYLRIWAGAGLVALAVVILEVLQGAGVLPGQFRVTELVSAAGGILAAAGPMWIGAHRARHNMVVEKPGP